MRYVLFLALFVFVGCQQEEQPVELTKEAKIAALVEAHAKEKAFNPESVNIIVVRPLGKRDTLGAQFYVNQTDKHLMFVAYYGENKDGNIEAANCFVEMNAAQDTVYRFVKN